MVGVPSVQYDIIGDNASLVQMSFVFAWSGVRRVGLRSLHAQPHPRSPVDVSYQTKVKRQCSLYAWAAAQLMP